MCQMVVSDNKLGNCGDSSAYTRVKSLERSLILKLPCLSHSEFCDVTAAKHIFKLQDELKILYWRKCLHN